MKDTGGSAFPKGLPRGFHNKDDDVSGMTLRDYLVAHGPWTIENVQKWHIEEDMSPIEICHVVAQWNGLYADEAIKERNK